MGNCLTDPDEDRTPENPSGITASEAWWTMRKLGIRPDFYKENASATVEYFRSAMETELEHGTRYPALNVTRNRLLPTGRIVLAHLLNSPTWYDGLKQMEAEQNEFWTTQQRPPVLKDTSESGASKFVTLDTVC